LGIIAGYLKNLGLILEKFLSDTFVVFLFIGKTAYENDSEGTVREP